MIDLSSLPVDDRLKLVQFLWDTIPNEHEIELSAHQKQELARRIMEDDADPDGTISQEEFNRRVAERRRNG